jgi:hypothetical protein
LRYKMVRAGCLAGALLVSAGTGFGWCHGRAESAEANAWAALDAPERVVAKFGPYYSKKVAEQVAQDLRNNGYPPSKGYLVTVEYEYTPRRAAYYVVVRQFK